MEGPAILGAGALTALTGNEFADLHLLLHAREDLFQAQFYLDAQVGALVDPTAGRAPKTTAKTPKASEDIPKLAENVIHRHTPSKASATKVVAHARMPELVVTGFLVGIAQNLVGFSSLLELRLGRGITRVLVGVILQRLLAVRLLDLLRSGITRNA